MFFQNLVDYFAKKKVLTSLLISFGIVLPFPFSVLFYYSTKQKYEYSYGSFLRCYFSVYVPVLTRKI